MPNAATQTRPENAPAATNAPPPMAPFTRGAREHTEGPFSDVTTQIGAAPVAVGPIDIPAYGFLASVLVLVQATGGADSGETVAFDADGPWSSFLSVQLTDVNGAPIVGPFAGFDLYLANKYGAYAWASDPVLSPLYGVTAGASASGDFSFALRIPVQITSRDALGALPNQNAASPYKISYTVNASTGIYSTAPDTLPAMRVRMFLEAWSQPTPTDLRGLPQATVPPALGTTQFWSKSVAQVSSGQQTVRLPRVGNLLREVLFVARDSSGDRIAGNAGNGYPDPSMLLWDGRILLNEAEFMRQQYVQDRFGFGQGESAQDAGVYVYDWAHDLTGHTGNEVRDLYLPTTQATRLELQGVFGADAATLDIITNDVAPTSDIAVS